MATTPATISRLVSPSDTREPVKYRASCDRCQSAKVRCNKDIPACKRCVKKSVICIYSPLRRTGRPKKSVQVSSADCSHADGIVDNEEVSAADTPAAGLTAATPAGYGSEGHQEPREEDRHISAAHLNNGLPPDRLESIISRGAETAMVGLGTGTPMNRPVQSGPSQSSSRDGSDLAAIESSATSPDLSEVRQVGIASQGSWSEGGTSPQETNSDTPETDLQAAGPRHDCYTTILVRTAELEQSLTAAPGLPPVDLLLGAERDVRALQERLFACTGHAPLALADHGANKSTNNSFANHIMRSCLWSGRPALLSLALLAERVVSMLEETLRSAARSSYESERTFRETPWLDAQVPAISARRLGRSFRSLMDRPCVFPVPQADQDLRIGGYVVDGQVKARALRRILQLRIRKLLLVLRSMEQVPLVSPDVDRDGGPLDWDGCGPVMGKAAKSLVENLIRRVEALRGRMALIG